MFAITKLATSAVLALALTASSLNVTPASAGNHNGAGLAIGIGAGLIIGGILLNAQRNNHPHHNSLQMNFGGGYDPYDNVGFQPACYLGPVQYRWVETCRQGNYGDLFCHKTRQAFQQRICN
jgi:hypothetical protein